MQSIVNLINEPEGLRYSGGALAYAVLGYVAGFAGLFHTHWAVNLAATLLLAHAMTISAYLIHPAVEAWGIEWLTRGAAHVPRW